MTKNNSSMREQICSAIIESIFNCEYKPGQILNEQELMERFSCSKSPVREALVSLCNENVLKNIPRLGYEVVRLTREDVEDMIMCRYILEGSLLLSCIDSITPAQIKRLKALDEECRNNDNVWSHWESNSNFHLQMVAFSHNSFAYEELERIMSRLKRAYAQFYWGRWERATASIDTRNHSQIIDCIEKRDAAGMMKALLDDLNDFGSLSIQTQDVFAKLGEKS